MSVRVIGFSAAQLNIWHDESSHGGTTPLSSVQHPVIEGVQDTTSLTLTCPAPGCGATSVVPIFGGHMPETMPRLAIMHRALKETGTRLERFTKARRAIKTLILAKEPSRWAEVVDNETPDDIENFFSKRAERQVAEVAAGQARFVQEKAVRIQERAREAATDELARQREEARKERLVLRDAQLSEKIVVVNSMK